MSRPADHPPRALGDGLGPFVAGAALGDHQRPDRLHRAIAAFRCSRGPPGLRGPGNTDRVQRVGPAVAAAVLPVGPVHLDDPDARRGHVPGQARAVAAGALDADQGDRPEPAQPARQAGVPGSRGRELLHSQQAAAGIQRGGDMGVRVGVHAAGDGDVRLLTGKSPTEMGARERTRAGGGDRAWSGALWVRRSWSG